MGKQSITKQMEQSPLPTLLQSLAAAIAEAQYEMDRHCVNIVKLMADRENNGIQLTDDGPVRSLLQLGLRPTFYHFTEATIEARVAFSIREGQKSTVGASIAGGYPGVFSASVSAEYTSKYSFQGEASSIISTKIITVPPPAQLNAIVEELENRDD